MTLVFDEDTIKVLIEDLKKIFNVFEDGELQPLFQDFSSQSTLTHTHKKKGTSALCQRIMWLGYELIFLTRFSKRKVELSANQLYWDFFLH
jgi:hypothetical protein